MLARILATIALIFSVLFLPYWATISACIIFALVIPLYIEGVILMLLLDAFASVHGFRSLSFLLVVVAIAISFFIRTKFRTA